MSRQIDLQAVLSDDELEYLEARGRDNDLAVNAAFLINESDDKPDGNPEKPSDADPSEAGKSEGDEGEADVPPDAAANDDQKPSEPDKVQTSTATRQPAKKS